MGENPVRYMMGHEEIILDAYQGSKGPKGAWESLQEVLPDLPQVMRYNTFKQYITPFSMIMDEVTQRLHRNEQSRTALKETIKALRQEKNMVERRLRAIEGRRLHKVTQKGQSQAVRQGLHKEVKKTSRAGLCTKQRMATTGFTAKSKGEYIQFILVRFPIQKRL